MIKMVVLNMCDLKRKRHWHAGGLDRSEGEEHICSYYYRSLSCSFISTISWNYTFCLFLLELLA